MATKFSTPAWRISWTDKPGELWTTGLQRVRHDWSDWTCMHAWVVSYNICLSLSDWLSMIISRPIHITANGIVSSFSMAESHSSVHMYHTFIHYLHRHFSKENIQRAKKRTEGCFCLSCLLAWLAYLCHLEQSSAYSSHTANIAEWAVNKYTACSC